MLSEGGLWFLACFGSLWASAARRVTLDQRWLACGQSRDGKKVFKIVVSVDVRTVVPVWFVWSLFGVPRVGVLARLLIRNVA